MSFEISGLAIAQSLEWIGELCLLLVSYIDKEQEDLWSFFVFFIILYIEPGKSHLGQ